MDIKHVEATPVEKAGVKIVGGKPDDQKGVKIVGGRKPKDADDIAIKKADQ